MKRVVTEGKKGIGRSFQIRRKEKSGSSVFCFRAGKTALLLFLGMSCLLFSACSLGTGDVELTVTPETQDYTGVFDDMRTMFQVYAKRVENDHPAEGFEITVTSGFAPNYCAGPLMSGFFQMEDENMNPISCPWRTQTDSSGTSRFFLHFYPGDSPCVDVKDTISVYGQEGAFAMSKVTSTCAVIPPPANVELSVNPASVDFSTVFDEQRTLFQVYAKRDDGFPAAGHAVTITTGFSPDFCAGQLMSRHFQMEDANMNPVGCPWQTHADSNGTVRFYVHYFPDDSGCINFNDTVNIYGELGAFASSAVRMACSPADVELTLSPPSALYSGPVEQLRTLFQVFAKRMDNGLPAEGYQVTLTTGFTPDFCSGPLRGNQFRMEDINMNPISCPWQAETDANGNVRFYVHYFRDDICQGLTDQINVYGSKSAFDSSIVSVGCD